MSNKTNIVEDELSEYIFYKENEDDQVYQVDHTTAIGELLYSFDGKTILNLWTDYPEKFTKEQKEIFDKQEPYWANFFKARGK